MLCLVRGSFVSHVTEIWRVGERGAVREGERVIEGEERETERERERQRESRCQVSRSTLVHVSRTVTLTATREQDFSVCGVKFHLRSLLVENSTVSPLCFSWIL